MYFANVEKFQNCIKENVAKKTLQKKYKQKIHFASTFLLM